MRIGDRLRLHAVGVGRDQRVDVLLGQLQKASAGVVHRVGVVQQLAAQGGEPVGGVHILAAAAGVDQRGLRAYFVDHDALDLQHVTGLLTIRLAGLIDNVLNAAGNLAALLLADDLFLGQHDDGRLVDPVDPGELVVVLALLGTGTIDRGADLRRLGRAFGRGAAGQVGRVRSLYGQVAGAQRERDGQGKQRFLRDHVHLLFSDTVTRAGDGMAWGGVVTAVAACS